MIAREAATAARTKCVVCLFINNIVCFFFFFYLLFLCLLADVTLSTSHYLLYHIPAYW